LENLNANLRHKLEETTETLNNVKTKLNLQNDLRQKGYDDYQVKLASMNTTIDDLESSLKVANENEIHLKNSLKETNAEKDTLFDSLESLKETNAEKIEGLERLNFEVKSELEKTKHDIENLENQLKTCKNSLKESNAGSRKELRMKIKELEDLNVKSQFKWNKTKQEHLSEVASKNNKIKCLEIQMKTLEEDLKEDLKVA
jgi:chromosome segregation ATPase